MDKANKWNMNLIKHSFNEQVVEEILQIEIVQGQDALVWKFKRNVLYSVASGYSITFHFSYPPSSKYPVHFSNKDLWRLVWCLRTPLKLKVLVWKLMQNGVLVRQHLREKFSAVNDRCPWCLNKSESMYHCFIRAYIPWRYGDWPILRKQIRAMQLPLFSCGGLNQRLFE